MAVSSLYLNGKEINTLYIGGKLFYQKIEPGLYDVNDNFIVSYEESGLDVTRSYYSNATGSTHKTEASSGYSTLLRYPDCVRIVLPNNITQIGSYSLASCTNLVKINIPGSVTYMGRNAFMGTNITEIEIPGTIDQISHNGFYNCKNLTSVKIGNGTTSISSGAFMNDTSLRYIILPKTLNNIWEAAFQDTDLSLIYYEGTKNEWKTIQIADETMKSPPANALRYYSEEDPWWASGLERALYWRYVNGKPKLWSQS